VGGGTGSHALGPTLLGKVCEKVSHPLVAPYTNHAPKPALSQRPSAPRTHGLLTHLPPPVRPTWGQWTDGRMGTRLAWTARQVTVSWSLSSQDPKRACARAKAAAGHWAMPASAAPQGRGGRTHSMPHARFTPPTPAARHRDCSGRLPSRPPPPPPGWSWGGGGRHAGRRGGAWHHAGRPGGAGRHDAGQRGAERHAGGTPPPCCAVGVCQLTGCLP
jgi:hypothetical protein